jgi:ADP-dependent NAD(P)H-hydrate dehydratase / NAD(P)H-hydrate epimerase
LKGLDPLVAGVARAIAWREARRLDLNAEERGVPVADLMQRAGAALARIVRQRLRHGEGATFFCGKGNNGADGLVAAARLIEGGTGVRVVLAEPPERMGPLARDALARLEPGSWQVWSGRPPRRDRVLVDALLGAGLSGPPRPPYDAIVRHLRRAAKAGAHVVACDVPTGLGTPLAVAPAETVTFHAPKAGMTRANSGAVTVAPIGIPRAAEQETGLGDLWLGYRVPRPDSHKGENGRVLLVAGCLPYTGAPHYAALGAYRSGADLVHAVVPGGAAAAVRAYGPHPIVHAEGQGDHLAGTEQALRLLDRVDTLAIGCGLGPHPATRRAAAGLIGAAGLAGRSIVVDADGLDALTPELLRAHGARMVLTPHAREFQDLAGREATPREVAAYARRHGVTVLRKAQESVIAAPGRTRRNLRGHPTLTVGGTGDLITGAVAALLAKGAGPFEAACAASYLVGCAGEEAARRWSWGATAVEVADAIPSVLLRLERALA